jgi:quercetin dioxygenase-like cupin family protein
MSERDGNTARHERMVTSGGAARPARTLRRPHIVNVADQASTLMSEPEWHTGDRNSITVATTDRMRITLTALHPGAAIGSDDVDDTLVVQILRGQIRLEVSGMDLALGPGQLTTVEDPGPWRISAQTESLLLLTAAHPDGSDNR